MSLHIAFPVDVLCALALSSFCTPTSFAPQAQVAAPPGLFVELLIDKNEYLALEPMRLICRVSNKGPDDLHLTHAPAELAADLVFDRVRPDGALEEVARSGFGSSIDCPVGEDFSQPRTWTLRHGETHSARVWSDTPYPRGPVRFRAALRVRVGPHAGSELWSQDVDVQVVDPQGPDHDAWEFMSNHHTVQLTVGSTSSTCLIRGLIFHSGSHLSHELHQYFVDHFSDTLYAKYVRYAMGMYQGYAFQDAKRAAMESILERDGQGFALLAETCAELLQCYLDQGELERMSELAQRVERESIRSVDLYTQQQLTRLLAEIRWWPPSTPEETEKARHAELIRRAKAEFQSHNLVRALTDAFGPPRHPMFTSGEAEACFRDPRSRWAVRVRCLLSKDGALTSVSLQGALESFRIGMLTDILHSLETRCRLDPKQASSVFLDVRLVEGVLTGSVHLESGRREFRGVLLTSEVELLD